jgi:dihydrofolate reductase
MPQFSALRDLSLQSRAPEMSSRSRVAIIAAVARNGVIGRRNRMPWHLPEDLKRFKRLTLGHAVIMGRRTFESIGKPLAGRSNIVVTRSPDWTRPGCHAARSLEAALAAVHDREDAFVIGGAEIYALAFPLARRLYMTEIERDFEGDAFFPQFDRSRWREVSRESRVLGGAGGFSYHFVAYDSRA